MRRVLVTPLDWGLGHATRCIPVIREFLSRNCTVSIAGTGESLALLKSEFPKLTYFNLPGYRPVYPSGENMMMKMFLQVPKFIHVIRKEHRQIESIIKTNKIDLIISDNRYGCWSRQVPSIFITHQLNILMPAGFEWLSGTMNLLNRRLIRRFSRCWIPDYPEKEKSLSGKLSAVGKNGGSGIVHIGPLSRFNLSTEVPNEYDVAFILSGPEPQRSIFESKVVNQLRGSALRYFVARGVVVPAYRGSSNEAAFLNSEALQNVISRSSVIIARSGYSTIMDLVALRKKGIVVPTPGQTEQEYLADRWSKRGVLYLMSQESFNLDTALKESDQYTGFTSGGGHPTELLKRELDRVLAPASLSNTSSNERFL